MVASGTVAGKELGLHAHTQNVGLRQNDPEASPERWMRSSEANVLRDFWPLVEKDLPIILYRFHDKLLGVRVAFGGDDRQANRLDDILGGAFLALGCSAGASTLP